VGEHLFRPVYGRGDYEACHKLKKLQHEAEATSFPDGLAPRDELFAQAQQEAKDYFKATYGVE
jgi:hypothetical protein